MEAFIEQLKTMDRNQLILAAAQLKKASLPEPIAIVGIGCDFPGEVNTTESFWELVKEGRDTAVDLNDQRWRNSEFYSKNPNDSGRSPVTKMALLATADSFDAELFGISPEEAKLMDPQQRWLLQCCWHALEDAGMAPTGVKGKLGGVYVGLMNHDYEQLQHMRGQVDLLTGYTAVGNSMAVSAGRVSYFFGLQGPSLALDTACSSSLVSVHLACEALRNKQCDFALAGGVNAILSPTTMIAESKAQMLSADRGCRSFDAESDGFLRGEGCGMVVLKRLSDARKDKDRIYAVIKGSAVNQDGRSQGLMAPNSLSQQMVIKAALAQAQVAPSRVGFVEAHGTGTPLGDPIEITALTAVYGTNTRTNPLNVSSIKTNFGHTESAAGIAGLIKLALARFHSTIPKLNLFNTLNPHIQLDERLIKFPLSNLPWPEDEPFGGVSAFGFGGTNAHVIVGKAPDVLVESSEKKSVAAEGLELVCFSAQHPESLALLATSYQNLLTGATCVPTLAQACRKQRAHLKYRQAWVVKDNEIIDRVINSQLGRAPKTVWLFAGQNSQYQGMAERLYKENAVFNAALNECAAILDGLMPVSLFALLWGDSQALLGDACYSQPAVFSIEYSLTKMWQQLGLKPDLVMGYSCGEYTAATVAGIMTFEEAIHLIWARVSAIAEHCEPGVMLELMCDEVTIQSVIAEVPEFSIAAHNTSHSWVVAGPESGLNMLMAKVENRNICYQRLATNYAMHTSMMKPMVEHFLPAVHAVEFKKPKIPFVSSITGKLESDRFTSGDYWIEQLLAPIKFDAAIQTALSLKIRGWFELSPCAALTSFVRHSVTESDLQFLSSSLDKGVDDQQAYLAALGRLYCFGFDVDLSGLDKEGLDLGKLTGGQRLPLYPFHKQSYWFEHSRVFSLGGGERALEQEPMDEQNQESNLSPSDLKKQQQAFLEELEAMDVENQWLTLVGMTRGTLAKVLDMDEEEIPLDVDLFDLGVNSVRALNMRSMVQQKMGFQLSATLLFDYSNVLALVDYFGIKLLKIWRESPLKEEQESVQVECEKETDVELG